jgi:p38 MAP kinase
VLNLLEKMLAFDPRGRICASDALSAPYLASYHDPTDEPLAEEVFDWSFNGTPGSSHGWKHKLYFNLSPFINSVLIPSQVR